MQVNFAIALECYGPIAIQFQLVFPVIAFRQGTGGRQEHRFEEADFRVLGVNYTAQSGPANAD
jgi:hypothetical protein